jgi:hypothetical protein
LEFSLAPGEVKVLDFPFESGGRFAITVRGAGADAAAVRFEGSEEQLQWRYFDARLGRVVQPFAMHGTAPIGTRVEVVTVLPVGSRKVSVTLLNAQARTLERTVEIVPRQCTELVVDFDRTDGR